MKKVLFYEPFAGISGDMNLGAMIDLGVPEECIIDSLRMLDFSGWSVSFRKEQRKGITGIKALVDDGSGDCCGHHHHRSHNDIKALINKSSLNPGVKALSLRIFEIVAEAEAKVHDKIVDEIHFHEVGAVDSIIDIVSAAAAVDYLKPDRIISTSPELGGGFVKCAHGTIPVPAPATVEILKGIETKSGRVDYEATTPTGAAILKALVDDFVHERQIAVDKIGYGAGTIDGEIPNLLRVSLGTLNEVSDLGEVFMIECNIDDMNPEMYGHVSDRLFNAGVKDVFMTPVYMKKNRPGTLLSVMVLGEDRERARDIIFSETSTAGLREYPVRQTMLEREFGEIETCYGRVRIKTLYRGGVPVTVKAEYDDVRKLAVDNNVSIKEVYRAAGF